MRIRFAAVFAKPITPAYCGQLITERDTSILSLGAVSSRALIDGIYKKRPLYPTIKKEMLAIVYALAKMAAIIIYISMADIRRPKRFTTHSRPSLEITGHQSTDKACYLELWTTTLKCSIPLASYYTQQHLAEMSSQLIIYIVGFS